MLELITMLKEQVQKRMKSVPSTLWEYYNGKLDMITELENILSVIETGNGFETIDEKE